jgi:hypothetical protein
MAAAHDDAKSSKNGRGKEEEDVAAINGSSRGGGADDKEPFLGRHNQMANEMMALGRENPKNEGSWLSPPPDHFKLCASIFVDDRWGYFALGPT